MEPKDASPRACRRPAPRLPHMQIIYGFVAAADSKLSAIVSVIFLLVEEGLGGWANVSNSESGEAGWVTRAFLKVLEE